MKIIFTIFLMQTLGELAYSVESRESFEIYLYGEKTKVLSPQKVGQKAGVIFRNFTFNTFYGRIQNKNQEVIQHVAIAPNKVVSTDFFVKKNDHLIFLPLSPGMQEVILRPGATPYEIPFQGGYVDKPARSKNLIVESK